MTPLALLLATLAMATQAPARQPRVSFDAVQDSIDGEPLVHVVVHSGHGGPDSAPQPVAFFTGHLNSRSAADSLLYVFCLEAPQDTTRLQLLLTAYRKARQQAQRLDVNAWGTKQAPFADLFGYGALLRVPVDREGVFIFEVENQKKRLMALVDSRGNLAAQRRIWKE